MAVIKWAAPTSMAVHRNTGPAAFSGWAGGAGALIRLSTRNGENSRSFRQLDQPWRQSRWLLPATQSFSPRSSHPSVNAELTPPFEERSQSLNQRLMVVGGTIGWRTRSSMETFSLVIGGVLWWCNGCGDHMRSGFRWVNPFRTRQFWLLEQRLIFCSLLERS